MLLGVHFGAWESAAAVLGQHTDCGLHKVWVVRKELLHILRDPQTLFFTLFVPVMELFMLGYAIDTNVRNVRTAVVDHSGARIGEVPTVNDWSTRMGASKMRVGPTARAYLRVMAGHFAARAA